MKLRNKKTGEIGNLITICASTRVFANGESDKVYSSLDELNEEWEDYEEPETYYYISDLGNIESLTNDHGQNLPEEIWHKAIKRRKEIGNHFETEEKTEKAVKKLEALTRLRNKGLKILGFHSKDRLIADSDKKWRFSIEAEIDSSAINNEDDCKMIELLFGGEE